MIRDKGRTRFYTEPMADSRPKPTLVYYCCILVPSLSARHIFIAYSMKNRQGKSGSKRHGSVTRCLFNLVNVIVRLRHECQRVCKQRAEDTRTEALDK